MTIAAGPRTVVSLTLLDGSTWTTEGVQDFCRYLNGWLDDQGLEIASEPVNEKEPGLLAAYADEVPE